MLLILFWKIFDFFQSMDYGTSAIYGIALCTMLGMITTWRAGCAVHILLPHPPCLLHARLLHRINETLYRGDGAEGDAGGVWASGPQYSGEVRAEHCVHRRLSEYSVFDQHYSVDSVSVSRYKTILNNYSGFYLKTLMILVV